MAGRLSCGVLCGPPSPSFPPQHATLALHLLFLWPFLLPSGLFFHSTRIDAAAVPVNFLWFLSLVVLFFLLHSSFLVTPGFCSTLLTPSWFAGVCSHARFGACAPSVWFQITDTVGFGVCLPEGCSPLGLTFPSSTSYSWQCRRREDREASSAQCLSTGIVLSGNSPSSGEASGQGFSSQSEAARGAALGTVPQSQGLREKGWTCGLLGVQWPTLAYFQPLLASLLPVARGPVQGPTNAVENRGFPRVLASSRGSDGPGWHAAGWEVAAGSCLVWGKGSLKSLLAKADSQNFFSDSKWLWIPINIPNIQNTVHHFQRISRHLFKKKLVTLKQEGAFLAV